MTIRNRLQIKPSRTFDAPAVLQHREGTPSGHGERNKGNNRTHVLEGEGLDSTYLTQVYKIALNFFVHNVDKGF
jgi:hypothetical protein